MFVSLSGSLPPGWLDMNKGEWQSELWLILDIYSYRKSHSKDFYYWLLYLEFVARTRGSGVILKVWLLHLQWNHLKYMQLKCRFIGLVTHCLNHNLRGAGEKADLGILSDFSILTKIWGYCLRLKSWICKVYSRKTQWIQSQI